MGKRKERRLAAMAAAGRRVKLDLFAEHSGELGSSSMHDEVAEDQNPDHDGGAPGSSPSGKKQDNPLSLLGQYSDGESDEDDLEKHNIDDKYSSLTKQNLLVQENANHHENVDLNTDKDRNSLDNKVAMYEVGANLDHCDGDVNSNMMVQHSVEVPSEISVSETSTFHISVDTVGVWKVQLDEQTNQYYYWNTETGETSWEVPSGLISAAQNLEQSISSENDERVNSIDANVSISSDQAIGASNNGPTSAQLAGGLSSSNSTNYGIQAVIAKGHELDMHLCHSIQANDIPYGESATMPEFISSQQAHALPTSDQILYPAKGSSRDNENLDFDSAQLVSYGESLLERLEAIGRTGNKITRHDALKKEIEIRLSDCKALSAYGSSLMPFWWHIETQLKQLDSCIATEAASRKIMSDDVDIGTHSISREESSQGGPAVRDSDLVMKGENTSLIDEANLYHVGGSSKEEELCYKPISEDNKETNEVSEKMVAIVKPSSKSAPGLEMHAEDVDMDVEMEVDDDIIQTDQRELITTKLSSPSEQPSETCPPSFIPIVSSDDSIPPPPDEEWIPPPPPESEPVPPPPPLEDLSEPVPPPDELPAQAFPHENLVSSHTFQDHHSLAYDTQPYNYYASASGVVATNTYYGHVGEVANPSQAAFYDTANANAYPLVVTSSENAVENREYYQAANVSVAPVPAISGIDSSGYYNSAVPLPGQTVAAESLMESQGNSASIVKPASVNSSGTTKSGSPGNPLATDISLINDATTNVVSVPVARNQSKVVRSKKRLVPATTLRSNKKVSSLVDKWKAAKEELQAQEDEEPENPYDLLERKRQKEIEEWHARQISSGEAQDNANFVPLRGDWREKVKRRKAKAEAVQSPPKEAVDEGKKKPNLIELAKNLPPGWQAYWDDTSKDVYYGNTITSETTWTRPSR